MNAIGFFSGNERFGRQTKHLLSPLGIGILVSLALLTGSTPLYAGKPATKLPKLNSVLCPVLGGTWDLNTCTIGGGAWGQATSDFIIPDDVSLIIQGDGVPPESPTEPYIPCTFAIGFGVTLENAGLIRIETTGTIGFCNLGTLKNAGSLEVAPVSGEYEGNTGLDNLSTITNSGTITVNNSGGLYSVGIRNLPHIPEADPLWTFDTILPTITNSGTIVIENNGDASTGIRNEGALSNAGNITVSADIVGYYGVENQGAFTNEASGTLVNLYGDTSLVPPMTSGVMNYGGTMINYGSVNNSGVIETDGWAMLTFGTLDNHGVLFQSGGVLVNYGMVNNWGAIRSDGTPDYPHNQGVCIDWENGEGC